MQKSAKKILIFGASRSGISALKMAKKIGYDVLLVDQNPLEHNPRREEILSHIDESNFVMEANLPINIRDEMDQVVISPGISLDHPMLAIFQSQSLEVIGEVEFAYRCIFEKLSRENYKIIAVTGTNGKTTTVSFISHLLKSLGKQVFLGGNIGIPFSDYFLNGQKEEYIVLELSSFQLETINYFQSDVAIITNISPAHSERYDSLDEYKQAKFNIFRFNQPNSLSIIPRSLSREVKLPGEKVLFSSTDVQQFKDKYFFLKKRKDDFGFWEDLYLGFRTVSFLADKKALSVNKDWASLITSFSGVEHRNEEISHQRGSFKIINNSKSTNFNSTTLFLKFRQEPLDLIIGGKLRDDTPDQGKELLAYKSVVNSIYLFGESAPLLEKNLASDFTVYKFSQLEELLTFALKQERKTDLFFSPCYPSFDQYLNFEERGKHFKKLVQNLEV